MNKSRPKAKNTKFRPGPILGKISLHYQILGLIGKHPFLQNYHSIRSASMQSNEATINRKQIEYQVKYQMQDLKDDIDARMNPIPPNKLSNPFANLHKKDLYMVDFFLIFKYNITLLSTHDDIKLKTSIIQNFIIYLNVFVQQQFILFTLLMKGKLIITQENGQHIQIKTKKIKKINKPQQSLIEKVTQQNHQIKLTEPQQNQPTHTFLLPQKQHLKHLSICFPDSILELPQTSTLRAYFISQVARISAIFKVDEIIILKDHSYTPKSQNFNPCEYLARNLQYLQTPQYLRKYLFKMHPDLQNAGLMNPIESAHHLKTTQISEFRDGVVLDRPAKKGHGSWVDIGLKTQARIEQLLLPMTRVTLKIKNYQEQEPMFFQGQAVSKKSPKEQKGIYWGYDVRIARNIKDLIENSPIPYDISILCNHKKQPQQLKALKYFKQMDLDKKSILLFFSGTDDLETLIEKDSKSKLTTQQAIKMFDYSIGFVGLGVKQLRLEQQIFIALTQLSEVVS